jgi:hypothetical protein
MTSGDSTLRYSRELNSISIACLLSIIARNLNRNAAADSKIIFVLNANAWNWAEQHCPFRL